MIVSNRVTGERDLQSVRRPVRVVVDCVRIVRNVLRHRAFLEEITDVHNKDVAVERSGEVTQTSDVRLEVGHHQQIARGLLDGANGSLHDAVVVISAAGHFVLDLRQAKQDHRPVTQKARDQAAMLLDPAID